MNTSKRYQDIAFVRTQEPAPGVATIKIKDTVTGLFLVEVEFVSPVDNLTTRSLAWTETGSIYSDYEAGVLRGYIMRGNIPMPEATR